MSELDQFKPPFDTKDISPRQYPDIISSTEQNVTWLHWQAIERDQAMFRVDTTLKLGVLLPLSVIYRIDRTVSIPWPTRDRHVLGTASGKSIHEAEALLLVEETVARFWAERGVAQLQKAERIALRFDWAQTYAVAQNNLALYQKHLGDLAAIQARYEALSAAERQALRLAGELCFERL
jgi:hypothetical protein